VVWKKKNINNDIETNVFVFPTRISQVQYWNQFWNLMHMVAQKQFLLVSQFWQS
jgi:hypothetical protein